MYTRGGKSTVEKPTLVNKPKICKGRLGEVREARGGKSTKPIYIYYTYKIQETNLCSSSIVVCIFFIEP